MTWRQALLRIAAGLRARAKNCRPFHNDDAARCDGQRFVYNTLADDFEFMATLKPHEGLRYLKEHY